MMGWPSLCLGDDIYVGCRLFLIGGGPITPALDWSVVFATGSGGAFDATDISTLWQDVAGTIPVTAVGQSVERMDDVSGQGQPFLKDGTRDVPIYTAVDGKGGLVFTQGGLTTPGMRSAGVNFSDSLPTWYGMAGRHPEVAASGFLGGSNFGNRRHAIKIGTNFEWTMQRGTGSISDTFVSLDTGHTFQAWHEDAPELVTISAPMFINGTITEAKTMQRSDGTSSGAFSLYGVGGYVTHKAIGVSGDVPDATQQAMIQSWLET